MFDAVTDSYDELSKKASESKSAYEGTKSEVESLNGQLETTQQRINELHAQGTLSITDAAELAQLEAQNEQLRTQIALKQQIADLQQAEAVKNAAAALTVQDRQAEEAVYNGSEVIDTRYYNIDILEETRKKQEELNATREAYILFKLSNARDEIMCYNNARGYTHANYEHAVEHLEKVGCLDSSLQQNHAKNSA